MWTAPIGKRFFAVTNDLVGSGHMSGLLVRHMTAGPDDFRLPRSLSFRRALRLVTTGGVSLVFGGDRVVHHFFRACQTWTGELL